MAEDLNQKIKSLFHGFSKLTRSERLDRLVQMGALEAEDLKCLLKKDKKIVSLSEKFIENVVGYFELPMGVAANFLIDGKAYVIPMAVEETSIIAAASKTAKWVRENGEITTGVRGRGIIGQIQIARVKNFEGLERVFQENRSRYIQLANEKVAQSLVSRGGGVFEMELRRMPRPEGGSMAVIHVHADTCDAMGANLINQICEFLKTPIEMDSGEKVAICILSNLSDCKLTYAKVKLMGLDAAMMERISEASLFANTDPYRACTNNKGVLNGIDPILIATGNDWRAVEAGVHAYAARSGQYRSITQWFVKDGELCGEFEAPIMLGVVGGVTTLHPMAKVAIRMLSVEGAEELARVCAAVGLVQNLGALRALTTEGIIEGHMKLHIKNLTIGAGAEEREIPYVQKRLEEILALTKRITLTQAVEVLKELRTKAGESAPVLNSEKSEEAMT